MSVLWWFGGVGDGRGGLDRFYGSGIFCYVKEQLKIDCTYANMLLMFVTFGKIQCIVYMFRVH